MLLEQLTYYKNYTLSIRFVKISLSGKDRGAEAQMTHRLPVAILEYIALLLLIFMTIEYNKLMIGIRYGKLMNKKQGFHRTLLILAGLAFVFMSIAGMLLTGMSMGMTGDTHGDMQGNMAGCPFMLGASICHMSLFEHIASWQTMFVATGSVSNVLLALLSVFVFAFFLSKYSYPPPRILGNMRIEQAKRRPLRFLETLDLAFSDGILNPKLF